MISDCGGNDIGIDPDPSKHEVKGQVILLGRDQEDMIVLAGSRDDFLDWNIDVINQEEGTLASESHLQEMYKQLKIS